MTTYSISLDDVDLALLPMRTRSNDFLKKELYEFTVMRTQEDDDIHDDDSSVNELYTCHICAIEVPSAFSNAHNSGAKHQCNVKIATEATKRMRELLTSNPPTVAQRGERFCDPCATIANEDHEKTKEHKLAVVHDRMLNELSNLYVGDDGESNKRNSETKAKTVVNKKRKRFKDRAKIIVGNETINGNDTAEDVKPNAVAFSQTVKELTDAKINLCANNDESSNGTDTAKVTKPNAVVALVANKFTQTVKELTNARMDECENSIESINGNDTATKPKAAVLLANKFTQTVKEVPNVKANGEVDAKRATAYVKIPLDMYIKIIKTIPLTPKIAVQAIGDRVQITVDDIPVTISSDKFHSFSKNGTQLMCLVCNVLLKPGDEEIHKLSVVHIGAILRVVDDANCIRQINQNWSHCIICNYLANNSRVDEHISTGSHLGKRREAVAFSVLEELQIPKLVSNAMSGVMSQYTYHEPLQEDNVVSAPALEANAKAQNVKPNTIAIPKIDKAVLAPNQTIPVKNAAKTKGGNVKNGTEKVVLQPVKIISEVNSVFPVDERIEYPFEPKDQGSVRCIICSCEVPRSIQNRADHMNGLRHANNVKKQFPPLGGFKNLDSA